MRRSRALVLFLSLFLVTVLIGSVVAIFSMVGGGGGPSLEQGSVLVLDISGPLPEQPQVEPPLAGLGSRYTAVLEIDSALRKAAVDDRIERVLVRPGPMLAGYGKIEELRTAIFRFKTESDGKPVTCWMETAGNKEYLLATACDEIYMAPEGFLLVNGMHLSVTFYKGTLAKLGIEAEFTRAGRYKSAVEAYTSDQMSPAFREMLESLADSLYDDFVGAIADSREMTPEQVKAVIDDPPFTAASAVRAGLVDGLYYRDQLLDHLAGKEVTPISPDVDPAADLLKSGDDDDSAHAPVDLAQLRLPRVAPPEDAPAKGDGDGNAEAEASEDDDDGPDRIDLDEYRLVRPSSLGLGGGPKVAVLYCVGQITSGSSNPGGGLSSQTMGSDTIAAALRKIRDDDSIKAVVMRVDSPGGSGLASDVIWHEVERVREKKPLVVSMGDYAASGGYYISMGADAIVAERTTLTGSIGVFSGKFNLAGLYDKVGLKTDSVKRGEMSDIFTANVPLGEDGRAKLEEFVDEFYGAFITKAAAGRHTTPEAIHAVAQGRVWTGEQALELGLIDEVGTLRTALQLAKEKAGLDGEVSLAIYPRQPTFWEQLMEGAGGPGVLAPLVDGWSPRGGGLSRSAAMIAAQRLLTAAPLFAEGQPVLLAPYHIEVE